MKNFSLSLRPLSGFETVLLIAVVAGLAFFLWRTWRERRSSPRRILLTGLRLAAAGLLTAAFLQPSVKRSTRMRSAPVAVVVDRSESMAVSDSGPQEKIPRWKTATDWVAGAAGILGNNSAPLYYTLDKKLTKGDPAGLTQTPPRGAVSDISSIELLPQEEPNLRAIFLLSDGRQGGGKDAASIAARLGVPVFSIGVGRAQSAPDLILDSVRAPHFAFKNTDVEVAVRVEKRNLSLTETTVEILEDGRAVASAQVRFTPGTDTSEAVLHLKPSVKGLKTFVARLPVFDTESNRRNNSRSFSMDVSRDRVRILYISGQPGPQYGFLREQLKSNPSVDLVTFVILRDPEDVVNFPDQELSLIPFPTQDVLFQQLKTFDLVIFEQFAFSMFGIAPSQLASVKEYVEKGGGLMLIGNSAIFGPSSPYKQTPLEEILPVPLGDLAEVSERFTVEVPEPGHPVMSLEDNVSASATAWRGLPQLAGDGRLPARAKPQALVLAAAQTAAGRSPVLAVWPRGKGRVMTFASLNSWQWALGEAGRGHGTWAYQRFWNNLLRWMSASEDFRLVRLDLPREPSEAGGDVWLRAFVRDENYHPLASGEVVAVVSSPTGKSVRRSLRALGNGEYADNISLEETGLYRVTVQAYSRQKRIGEDQGQMRVGLPWDENRDTATDFALLRRVSQSSGGEFVTLENATPEWVAKNLDSVSYNEQQSSAPWNAPMVFILMAAALLAEWTFRRRWGHA